MTTAAPWKDPVFEEWWPLGQALTLVRAPIRRVARAMKAEGKRAYGSTGAVHEFNWIRRHSIDDLFRSMEKFTVGPTVEIALPTKGKWTVILDNSSDCTPTYLAYRLTFNQKLETFTFYSTDRNSTLLAGTHFTHHRPGRDEEVIRRDVYCCNQGSRWHFEQHGDPLPEEDLEQYAVKSKRDRLNEAALMSLLERLGIHPWREDTYDFRKKLLCMTDRRQYPASQTATFEQIRARALGAAPPPAEDQELHGPPDYLLGNCGTSNPTGPARLLKGGDWCGHGEQIFWVYDIFTRKHDLFTVRLPEPSGIPVVEVTPKAGSSSIVIYDVRRHPANVFFVSDKQPVLQQTEECPKCGSSVFRASVGFEVPADAESANDTSWFALALQCKACGLARIAYEDETA
jgi:hypothetical protein